MTTLLFPAYQYVVVAYILWLSPATLFQEGISFFSLIWVKPTWQLKGSIDKKGVIMAAHFVPPPTQDNSEGWGPMGIPERFKDLPYQPFSKVI